MVARKGGKDLRRRASLVAGRLSRGEGECRYMFGFKWSSSFSFSFFQHVLGLSSVGVPGLSSFMTDYRASVFKSL